MGINLERKINALSSAGGITFAHKSDKSCPEQHMLHLSDSIEIYIYIKGDVHYVLEDQYYVLEKGDILIIPPYSTHMPILKNECDYERFYLLFPVNSLSDYLCSPLDNLADAESHEKRLRLSDDIRKNVLALLYGISGYLSESDSAYTELRVHALILEFICLINENLSSIRKADESARAVPKLVKDVIAYISDSCTEISGVAAVAEKFYVTEQYLSAVFKKHIGITVSSYLRANKISAAKRMLENGCSVTYTCYECGFRDCSYFIKVFREMVGMTPQKYSKSFR